jgi:hypothetical protein
VLVWNRADDANKRGRVISGMGELAAEIEKRYDVEVEVYEDWSTIPLRTQLLKSSQAAVYIGGAGGGTFFAWFLPRGGTKIQLNPSGSGHLDWHIFNNMAHIHTTHIDIPRGASVWPPSSDSRSPNITRDILAAVQAALARWNNSVSSDRS